MPVSHARDEDDKNIGPLIVKGVIGLLVAIFVIFPVLFGSWYTVDQTERGVHLRNGAYVGVVEPGLSFKVPWIDSIHKVAVTANSLDFKKQNSYSADQQGADIDLSVIFRVNPSEAAIQRFYTNYHNDVEWYGNSVVGPNVRKALKNIFGRYTAAESISNREKLNVDVDVALKAFLEDNDPGMVKIQGIQIENIKFSNAYEQSVEARMQAQVDVQKRQQQWEQQKVAAEITVTDAKAKADAIKAEADATAYSAKVQGEAAAAAIKARGDAEAEVIQRKADALKANPELPRMTAAERWDGKLPQTMVPNGTLPMIGIGGEGTEKNFGSTPNAFLGVK